MSTDLTQTAADEKLLYRSEVTVRPGGGPNKLVQLDGDGDPVVMGARGPLAEFLRVDTQTFGEHPSTLDYVVGATAGCLTGTFGRALAARGIALADGDLVAHASGDIVVDGGVPVLRRIHVRYVLRGCDDREAAARAHDVHHRGCAVSRSLEGAIAITTELELV